MLYCCTASGSFDSVNPIRPAPPSPVSDGKKSAPNRYAGVVCISYCSRMVPDGIAVLFCSPSSWRRASLTGAGGTSSHSIGKSRSCDTACIDTIVLYCCVCCVVLDYVVFRPLYM